MKTQTTFLALLRQAALGALLAFAGAFLSVGTAGAQTVTLSDPGTTATVQLTGSGAGMNSWSVLNQNQLNLQWFYYSINGGTAQSIDSLGLLSDSQGANNNLNVTYGNSQLSINVQYSLLGGGNGSGDADITETIAVNNLSGSGFNIDLYEYSNFNLLQSPNTVTIFGDGNGGYNYVQQTSGATAITEGIISPSANYAEAAAVPSTLNSITTVPNYQLNDNLTAGPGNVTWAFEWSQSVGAGQNLDIFKDKSLSIAPVPEPASIALIALGLGACVFGRRTLKK